ncbi:MAG: ATP-grasp domain-containing protein [Bacteroidales bacterium]|nr:ATP-grasp domain-containing protein [Bacteroidales bacterium]
MKPEINILFLGGARRTSLAERFVMAGEKLGKVVNVFSYELSKEVPLIAIAREIIVGKRWNDPQLFEHLLSVVKEKNIHILLPFVDPAVEVLALFRRIAPSDVFIPVSNVEIAKTFFDKKLANEWFIFHGFPVPEEDKKYPLIAKPRKGSAAKGLAIFQNEQEREIFFQTHSPEDYLIQAYLSADEFTVDSYVSVRGNGILGVVPRQRLEVFNGEVVKSVTTRNEEIIDLSKKILGAAAFCGPITIQFLRERSTGKIYVMEINPRFGGGVINTIEAGFDIPSILLKEYLNLPIETVDSWQENLMMMRTFKEIFLCK